MPGQDVVDRAEVDVAGDRAALRPLEVDLGDAVVLEDRDALLADVDGDQQLALGLRQRRPLLRHAAAVALLVGAALLPLAALRLLALAALAALAALSGWARAFASGGLVGLRLGVGLALGACDGAGLLAPASAAVAAAALSGADLLPRRPASPSAAAGLSRCGLL